MYIMVPDYVPGEINVTTYKQSGFRTRTDKCFVISCQSDRSSCYLSEISIVQNPTQVIKPQRQFYIQFWPRPGLRPRDRQRGTTIENIIYNGSSNNLDDRFKSESFRRRIEELGLTLSLFDYKRKSGHSQYQNYNTAYESADVVLAVRNLTYYDANAKPISKLANAWLAECPAILGPEPGFRAYRQTDLDYLEARSEDEVINYRKYLLDNRDVYLAMIENAKARAREVGAEQVKQAWIDLLSGPVAEQFEHWKRHKGMFVSLWRPAQFATRLVRHKIDRKIHAYRVNHGPRICDSSK